ncbi:MAG: hypothetical protein HS132_01895 [Planctomycetia bacterium]|nr:hypothetical protein [Planctomycetia bacterium]
MVTFCHAKTIEKNFIAKGANVKLSDVLTKERIIINLNGKDKYDVLEKWYRWPELQKR